jgi:hypothetical protein
MVPRQHTAFRLDPAAFTQARHRLALPGLLAAHHAHGGQRVAVEFQEHGFSTRCPSTTRTATSSS